MKKTFLLALLITACSALLSQPLTTGNIDLLVEKTMREFNVPGIAVAVVKDNEVIHMKGYGVSSIATGRMTVRTPTPTTSR